VNGLSTPWGEADLAAAAACEPDAILVPKISGPADLAAYDRALQGRTRLWAMMETCAAVFALDALAGAGGRLEALVVGGNDLAKEMRCRPGVDRLPLAAALSLTVAAARAHGLAAIDGVFNEIEDADGFARQCAQGADFGFDGKSLIHPSQIGPANAAFSPDPQEVAWARTVAAAFDSPENAGKGVLRVEGGMVELLHLDEARRLIAVSEAIAGERA
jgi:citrate lyase subunit beta/citryl-CoA lyase